MGAFDFVGNIPGMDVFQGIQSVSYLANLAKILLSIFIFLIIGSIVFFILWRIQNKKLYNKKIFWFEEVNGMIVPVDEDLARELTIPNTNITTFYIKKKDLYLPRPVKRMGKDSYWFLIKNNREIINFSMKNINKNITKGMPEADLDYDHTDMRYAYINLREIIKRNYRDGSKKWWVEYKDVIATILLIFMLTISFYFLITKMGDLIDKIGALINSADQLVKAAEATRGSGVIGQ